MSFAAPARLWFLLAVAVLAVAYVIVQLGRRRALDRYASRHLQAAVAPDRLGWRRHVAPALSLVALALIVVGTALPTRPERVPRRGGVVVLAVDVSLSMTATDISPSRLDAVKDKATAFVGDLPPGMEVGLVAFDGNARLLVAPTTDQGAVRAAIATLQPGPSTAAGEALSTSLDAITTALGADNLAAARAAGNVPAAIVLLSDGTTTVGRPVEQGARAAGAAGVPVSTIAYGTPSGTVVVEGQVVPVPADDAAMKAVADLSGGKAFEATSAGQLADVYRSIQADIGYTTVPREVTRGVLGAALVLLAGAVALATTWAARAL
ncbi:MAG: VWA domain-containing protein [Actinobacteria bacterium]|nr:VWA domain-containing protein [Actinomycetota bacterium]